MQLKKFQGEAAELISNRYAYFAAHPDRPRKGVKPRPFFQALSALTGAGKTPILAQAVTLIRGHLDAEPIVFWMSKARSVVGQTLTNFSEGGKYSELIEGFEVISVGDLKPALISDTMTPLMILATTGLFNNKGQSEGALNIYKKENDEFGNKSPWQRLIERNEGGVRRPLIVVYDEGHNLSEQQSDLLAELEPEAYLLASATMSLPTNFQKSVANHVRGWVEESGSVDELKSLQALNSEGEPSPSAFITTAVQSKRVVLAELVKKAIQFDGTTAAMAVSLDALMQRLQTIEEEIALRNLSFRPKAIYVCKTNINDDGEKDDPSLPFHLRNAPPIRIWRYLVEQKGVDPGEIAIYANLAFSEGSKPSQVNLFSKGETDFDQFTAGNYRHIIFNLSLQEGWDDPECYLAYVDKSMGSAIQVEQIIGRVLRQVGATHYENPCLNTAHFFIRVDTQKVFSDTITKVKAKLAAEGAPIEISDNFGGGGKAADELLPKDGLEPALHHIYVDSTAAREAIAELIQDFPIFQEGDENSVGQAHAASEMVDLLDPNKEGAVEWKEQGQTNPIRLRWLVNTAIRNRSSRALAVTDLKDPKFDVRVQANSKAAKLADTLGREIVGAFFEQSELVYESLKPFAFGTLRVPKKAKAFTNGLYERYAGFNKLEEPFATELDQVGALWHRNPSAGGFSIPLLSEGDTASFYPDFIVWKDDVAFCLDTKGGHLLTVAVARKLFDIREDGKTRVYVRFISEGRQDALGQKALPGGYTVWRMKNGVPKAMHVNSLGKAVAECLKK